MAGHVLSESRELWCKPPSESKSPRTRNTDVRKQERVDVPAQQREQICPSSELLFYPDPQWIGQRPQCWRAICFQKLTISMLISCTNTLPDRKSVSSATWASLSAVEGTCEIDHHICTATRSFPDGRAEPRYPVRPAELAAAGCTISR